MDRSDDFELHSSVFRSMREALFDNVRCNTSGSVRVENVERRVERYVERYDVHLISFIRRDSNIPVKYVIQWIFNS